MAMPRPLSRLWPALSADARHWQILALSSLFVLSQSVSDWGAPPEGLAFALAGAAAGQFIGARATNTPVRLKSALITALSLSILLRAASPWAWALAGLIGTGGKYALRARGKHLFNPAALGIAVVTLALGAGAWVSPAQWGTAALFAAFAAGAAALVLSSAKRLDIALGFLAFHAAFTFGRALWLGDPLAIPERQMQSGALLVFAFFMVTDPRSTPDSRAGRLLFAFAVAAIAAMIGWTGNLPGEPIYALILAAPLTPLIDRWLPGGRFEWGGGKARADAPVSLEPPPLPASAPAHAPARAS